MSNDYNGKKRSELPDSVFGIPQERKYPMPDEKYTRSAIKLFNHVDPKYEEQLAKAVIKNMKKYGIDGSAVGPNNRLRKYLPKDMIKESAARPLIYTWERTNIPEYPVIRESSHKSDFSYSGIKTSAEKSEFKRDFREVFKEDPTESSINYMQMIKYKGSLVGYIGFSRYKEGKKKYLGIGNFMILKKYQRGGMGSKVIYDIIDRYKDNYDEIYCYVDKDNTNAIAFYKKIAKVNTDNLTRYGYYVTLYKKGSTNESVSILPQDTGITTVIFDLGDVLVSANIKDYLVADPEVPNEIVDELLKLWFIDKDEVDDTMDLDTYREIVNKRMGVEFSKYIPKLFQYNIDCVTAFDYTSPMIQDLKDKGYKVYYLSNWSAWTYDLLQEAGKFDFLELMDGGVFSYDVGYMKPDEEIYKILLNKYKINPEEAVFFDDREENIETANKLGIHGIHFPRHDASIVYNNLYGRKLAKTIYEDMDNIRYDFDQSYNDKVFGVPSIQEYGTTGGTIVGANQPDSVYIVNYMQNNVFSGYKEPKQAICKKGMNQMYTTKNGKAIPVDIDKFKEEASDISVFRFKETPILSFDKIIENASVDGDFYILLTGDYPTNQHEIEYDNRFIQEDNFFDKLDDITYCTESTIIGQIEATDYPYMKILTESMEGRCWNYYRDINGVFAMNELTGLRTPSYEDITDIPNSQIQLIERGTVYFGD